MTKGMAARAGFFLNFYAQIIKGMAAYGGGRAPVAPSTGDRPLSPVGGATGPPFFFLQGLRCKFGEKKLHFEPVALWEGDRGIFLKFSKTDIYF